MATKKQIAWRKKFAEMARRNAFARSYGGSKQVRRKRSAVRKVKYMAKYRRSRRSGSGGLFNMKKMLIGGAVGMVAAPLLAGVLPSVPSNIKSAGAGFAVAGPAGAIGAFLAPMLLNGSASSTGENW